MRIGRELVPEGYIDGYFAGPDTYTCVWEVKGKRRQFVYDTRTGSDSSRHYSIPFPDLIFAVSVSKGVRQSFYCFARRKCDGRICNYPFGNVSNEGSVCMGSIATKSVTPSRIEEDFFLGVTNNDYYRGIDRCGMEWTQPRLLQELKGKEKYPDNWLVESGMTLETIIKKFSR